MNAVVDISDKIIKTPRLILRPFNEDDLDDFYQYASVDGIGQMAGWLPHKDKKETKKILEMFIREKKTFAIEFNGKVVGSLGLEEYNETIYPENPDKLGREIGYVLSKEYWGQGLMPEAVRAVIDYLFSEVHLDFIICAHFVSNNQSKRVQDKVGFHHIKAFKYQTGYGAIHDAWLSILTKEEYLSKN